MATANSIPELTPSATRPSAGLLVVLAGMSQPQLEAMLGHLATTFSHDSIAVATPDSYATEIESPLRVLPMAATSATWTLTAADFVGAYQIAKTEGAQSILLLGPEAGSLRPEGLRQLAEAVLTTPTDLAMPCYDLPPRAGLVNSAILYPLTRALFASRARFPLALDLGLSMRMAEKLAAAGQRFTALNQGDALLWPINEAAAAGCGIQEFDAGPRSIPQPTEADLNAILARVTSSLFADVDTKAAFWQRARPLPAPRKPQAEASETDAAADIGPMLDAFHLAYTNLQEIWSLVLPPNSLLGIKRLSAMDAASFRMPDNLWARIVFDFLLAFRLRTINRGHLLGALTPLYLAWVASHINITASGTSSERHIEAVATAFEADKPYLVSRWRWPDRFNP